MQITIRRILFGIHRIEGLYQAFRWRSPWAWLLADLGHYLHSYYLHSNAKLRTGQALYSQLHFLQGLGSRASCLSRQELL